MVPEGFEQALRKLSSILEWRTALQSVENALRQDPQTHVPKALHALTAGTLKPKAAERLKQLLTNLAKQDPAVRAALAKAALQTSPEATQAQETLEKAGQPIKQLKQQLTQANTLAQQLKTLGAEDLANQLTKTAQQATQAVLTGADIAAEVAKLRETVTAHETKAEIIKQLKLLLKTSWAEKPARLLLQQTKHETSKQTLNTLLKKAEALNQATQALNKAIQQKTTTLQEATELLNQVLQAKTPQQAEQQAQTIEQGIQQAQVARKLGLTVKQITQYLNHIRNNYPQLIHQTITQTLTNPPTDPKLLEVLKREIHSNKPSYKTWALQKHGTPKRITKEVLNQPPLTASFVKEWESPDLGKWVESVTWLSSGTEIKANLENGEKVVVLSSSGKKIWETPHLVSCERIWRSAWSPDMSKLATISKDEHKITVFSSSGTKLWEKKLEKDMHLCDLEWSPDSSKLAVEVWLWDPKHDKEKIIVFSSSGSELWDSGTFSMPKTLFGPIVPLTVVIRGWSPDGAKLIISVSEEHKGEKRCSVIVYSSSGDRLWKSHIITIPKGWLGHIGKIVWSPDSTKLAIMIHTWKSKTDEDRDYIAVFDSSGAKLWHKGFNCEVESIAWSPQGDKIAVGLDNGRVIVFSSSGNKLWESPDLGRDVRSVAWSPQGDKLAVGGEFSKVIVFSSSGSKLWESEDLKEWVLSVAWSPDGTRIATGLLNHKVIVFGLGLVVCVMLLVMC